MAKGGAFKTPPTSPSSSSPRSAHREGYVELPARHGIDPLQQGALDGLCGVYAAINGIRLALAPFGGLSRSRAKELFAAAVEWLDAQGGLEYSVTTGMATRRYQAIAKRLTASASTPEVELMIERPDDQDWTTVEDAFAWIEDSLADGKPVLLALMGGLNHFTVCWSISPKTLGLFDSTGLKSVRRSSCALSRGAFHIIPPKGLMRIAVRRTR